MQNIETLAKSCVDEVVSEADEVTDSYGVFGHIVRMQDQFDYLKTLYKGRRTVKKTKAIHASLRRIAAVALVAMSIEGEDHASADKR